MTVQQRPIPVRPVPEARPSTYFYRCCAATLRAHVKRTSPEAAARDLFGDDVVSEILLKAASSPATTVTPAWAGALAATAIEDSVMQISSVSAAAALFQRGLKLDFGNYAPRTHRCFVADHTSGKLAYWEPLQARWCRRNDRARRSDQQRLPGGRSSISSLMFLS
jgi:hypothetical protein